MTLGNGDRITGEIVELKRGRLEVKTDDAGTIKFEWTKILAVQANRQFEVATSDGRRFVGVLARDGDRTVRVIAQGETVSLTTVEVTSILPIGTSIWRRFEGSVSVGFTYAKSNGLATLTENSTLTFRRPAFQATLTTSFTGSRQDEGDQPDNRGSIEMSYVRFRGRRWLVAGVGAFDRNESLGLDLRSQVGGAIGWRVRNSNRAQFNVYGGLSVNEERSTEADVPTTQNVEGTFVADVSFVTYDRPKTDITCRLVYYPSLNQWGRQRLQLDSSVKYELFKDFTVGFDLYDTFDSRPPDTTTVRNDFGITLSFGWTF